MIFTTFVLLIALGLFVAMVVLLEVGRRIGVHQFLLAAGARRRAPPLPRR